MRFFRAPTTVITDAEPSPDAQLRSRQRRYATMMGIRVVCLIAAAVLVTSGAPLLWLWVPLCLVGMLALPWMAVLIANDRPPRREHQLTNRVAFGGRVPRQLAHPQETQKHVVQVHTEGDTR